MIRVPEQFRHRSGPYGTTKEDGNNGVFFVKLRPGGAVIKCIVSDGLKGELGWEHVSASLPNRVPSWDELCALKSLFWEPEDCVVQFHPPESQYVNVSPFCLHLWRYTHGAFPQPPIIMV